MTPHRRSSCRRVVFVVSLAPFGACTADQYARDADREVASILSSDEKALLHKDSHFTIEPSKDALRAQLLAELAKRREERLRERAEELQDPALRKEKDEARQAVAQEKKAESEKTRKARDMAAALQQRRHVRLADVERRHAEEMKPFSATETPILPPRVMDLVEALDVAADNSRDYQLQKEQVYLAALDVTLERYRFDTHFGVTSSYDWQSTDDFGATDRSRTGTLNTTFSFSRTLTTGGLLVFDFTNTFLKRFTGIDFGNGKSTSDSSVMDITFSQPLLRGSGLFSHVVEEPLIQSERDAFYQLRSFERFRQEFAVTVAQQYFNLLLQIDSSANARLTYLQYIDLREQAQANAERGRLSQVQLDQARQQELGARDRWVQAQKRYEDQLDAFKITLGLPMETNFVPDVRDLANLRARGPAAAAIGESRAIDVALSLRLDHANELDKLADADRHVKVAADALRADLSVNGGVSVPTARDTVFDLHGGHTTWSAGASLSLPLDRLAERNGYRRTMILRDQQARATSLSEDTVRQDVRDALRNLEQLGESYRIQVEALAVADKRVISTTLTLQMGRSQVRDSTDALDSYNSARNAVTQTLVSHYVAELSLSRDMGLLEATPNGLELQPPPAERKEDADAIQPDKT